MLRFLRKNRGSEDRKIGTAMIGRSLGIGSVISCINTNSTQISIARTTVTACHRSQRCWFQFRKTTKCFERDKVYTNVNYRRQTSINPENQRTNTEIVAILIWFLGTCALPFLFRWASTTCALWHMFNTGTNRKAVHSELVAHVISQDFAAPWLYLCWTCVTCSVQAVLAQRNKNGSAQVPKNQMSIATISLLVLWFSGLIDVNQSEFCMHLFC